MDLTTAILDGVDARLDEIVDTRRQLHRLPELSFEEHQTTALVTGRLAELGLEVRPCPTPTGAVASLRGGRPGPTVLLRADIDALPVTEATGLAFASAVDGVMHACGHDAHAAMLLGAAGALAGVAESLTGDFLFVFQPGEEVVDGARAMVEGACSTTSPRSPPWGATWPAWPRRGWWAPGPVSSWPPRWGCASRPGATVATAPSNPTRATWCSPPPASPTGSAAWWTG